ncbi:hypothetical protein [Acidimangrovimonas sediminis]|uniref:hypothetical protein n=1 Tax=Acidimangrovimonas sediminis TaxID=2056283 RepID=UPI000C801ED3|nr:hypothetical protein [Acidimangrovimonas sediminis]
MGALAAIAIQAGLPLIGAILQSKLGPADGRLASDVLTRVASELGIPVDQLEAKAQSDQDSVVSAMRTVEAQSPAMVQLYMQEAQQSAALAAGEATDPVWMRAWRPAGMYMLGFLWLWNSVILHVANAIWKIALPPMPFNDLLQLSTLYMGLYMGGHTVKDVAGKIAAKMGGS